MIPRVEFVYSRIYDNHWRSVYPENYPSSKDISGFIHKVERSWRKVEPKVMKEISVASGLIWKEDKIKCFMVGRVRAFSYPMTIGIWNRSEEFIDNLVHELIHNIFIQNQKSLDKYWKKIHKKHSKESLTTRIHVPLHAIYTHVYLKIFDQKRLNMDIECSDKFPDYRKSWKIVVKEGYENILKELKQK